MKVLVTGATGFVGNYVIHALLKRGIPVIASSSSRQKASEKSWFDRVHFVEHRIDVHEPENMFNKFQEPDLLIHLAWGLLPDFKNQGHLEDVLPAHSAFLKNMISHGLKDLSCVGTCLEYGLQEGQLREDMKSEPLFAYPIAKDLLRQELTGLQSEFSFSLKWLRLFYMYGEGQSPKSILALLEKAILQKDTVFNMSLGEQVRDYLPVEAVAENIVLAAMQRKTEGIINCSSNRPITIRRLVEDYLKEKEARIELNLGYYPYTDYEPMRFWGDNARLLEAIHNSTPAGDWKKIN